MYAADSFTVNLLHHHFLNFFFLINWPNQITIDCSNGSAYVSGQTLLFCLWHPWLLHGFSFRVYPILSGLVQALWQYKVSDSKRHPWLPISCLAFCSAGVQSCFLSTCNQFNLNFLFFLPIMSLLTCIIWCLIWKSQHASCTWVTAGSALSWSWKGQLQYKFLTQLLWLQAKCQQVSLVKVLVAETTSH